MENELFDNVKKLYDCELYESVIPTASLLYTAYTNDRKSATSEQKYQVLLYMSHSNYYERNFRSASIQLESAVQMRESLSSQVQTRSFMEIEYHNKEFNEVEMHYKIAKCYRELDDTISAIGWLQSVPPFQRSPKVNMLLANLMHYGNGGNSKSEISFSYKDVLRSCPMALVAIDELLHLGVAGNDVNSLILTASPTTPPENLEWLNLWIKGHAELYTRHHLEAAKTFQHLNETTKFRHNRHLLTMIGKSMYYYGNFAKAEFYLETAVMLDPHNMEAVAPLVVVYQYNHKKIEHDKLVAQLADHGHFNSYYWFVYAQSFYANGKFAKAHMFTQKALCMNPRNIEALLLKGKIYIVLKRYEDAIAVFRSAQIRASYRFEIYKGLFHSYIGLKRIKEAQTMAALFVRNFNTSPRSYTLFGRTLFNSSNPESKKNARKFVEKALLLDENYTPAVALMVEICQNEGQTDKAIELLRSQIVNFPHPKLFTVLADILREVKDLNGALEYYTMALSMDPTNERAISGVNALGHASRMGSELKDNEKPLSSAVPEEISDEDWPLECDIQPADDDDPLDIHDDDDNNGSEPDRFFDPFWREVIPDLNENENNR